MSHPYNAPLCFPWRLTHTTQQHTRFYIPPNPIQQNPTNFPDHKIHQGLIFYKNKIWLNTSNPYKIKLLNEFHNSPISGHMGFQKTYIRLRDNFYWTGMCEDCKNFVSQCLPCQTTKYETKRPAGLLQPLPLPTAIWEDLSLDFITGLPPSHGFTVILVIVDNFSKGAHFAALPTHLIQLHHVIYTNASHITKSNPSILLRFANSIHKHIEWHFLTLEVECKLKFLESPSTSSQIDLGLFEDYIA